jgi:hypothetical protein
MSATIEGVIGLDAMADDLASAVAAYRRQAVDRAFETVEDVSCAACDHLERQVVVVSAHFALSHEF